MKRMTSMILSLLMLLCCLASGSAETLIPVAAEAPVPIAVEYRNHTAAEGVSPLTGLSVPDEPYTPIMLVLGGAPEAFPFWGISEASLLFQVPSMGGGDTKLMALFGDSYPEKAGGARSSRMTMLPLANAFDAAFVCAGCPPMGTATMTDVEHYLDLWGYVERGTYFNLLGTAPKERRNDRTEPHNLSAKVKEIHETLVKQGVSFEKRPFFFAEHPLEYGDEAARLTMTYFGNETRLAERNERTESSCSFTYQEGTGYTRTSASGLNIDEATGEPLTFANVIVVWVDYDSEIIGDNTYLCLKDQMVGSGQADIFQNGKHITGAWAHTDRKARLVFLSDRGTELRLQPGKTFVIVCNRYNELTIQN